MGPAGLQGPGGPQGPAGPQGPQGPAGSISSTANGPITINTTGAGQPASILLGQSQGGGLFGTNVAGNFHIDSDGSKADGRLYLNWFDGNGIVFGNGAAGAAASLTPQGVMTVQGAVNAPAFNGLSFYRQTCTKTVPFQNLDCNSACNDPANNGCSNTATRGTCVSAKWAWTPSGQPLAADQVTTCTAGASVQSGGGTLTFKCYCSSF